MDSNDLWQWPADQFGQLFNWLGDQITLPDPPAWLVDGVGAIIQVEQMASSLSAWIPIPVLIAVIVWTAIIVPVAIGIQVARIVASFFTLGGGAT